MMEKRLWNCWMNRSRLRQIYPRCIEGRSQKYWNCSTPHNHGSVQIDQIKSSALLTMIKDGCYWWQYYHRWRGVLRDRFLSAIYVLMWLGRCWVCHVGDTATNMTLALWMWNNTWQAELLISNHLLSWYAPGNCCTTVFLQHCLYTLVHHHVKCYRLEKKHCCLWCICPRTVQLSQILHFCAFFQSARCWSTF